MPSVRYPRDVLSVYADQVEALERLFLARAKVRLDRSSRFFGLREDEFEGRLEAGRDELDAWASLMIVAEFEAVIRRDMESRLRRRTKDSARRFLGEVNAAAMGRVPPLDRILSAWERVVTVRPQLVGEIRRLIQLRHWLAHGRYWSVKHGLLPSPFTISQLLTDYRTALKSSVEDFPLV